MNLKQAPLLLEEPNRSPATMPSKDHWPSTRRMPRISMSGTVTEANLKLIAFRNPISEKEYLACDEAIPQAENVS
jgi:hypothetical protein